MRIEQREKRTASTLTNRKTANKEPTRHGETTSPRPSTGKRSDLFRNSPRPHVAQPKSLLQLPQARKSSGREEVRSLQEREPQNPVSSIQLPSTNRSQITLKPGHLESDQIPSKTAETSQETDQITPRNRPTAHSHPSRNRSNSPSQSQSNSGHIVLSLEAKWKHADMHHPLPWKPAHANTRLQGKLKRGVYLKAKSGLAKAGNAKRLQ